ncbi:hypothetical protein ACJX0J_006845, partial [Zea mays]
LHSTSIFCLTFSYAKNIFNYQSMDAVVKERRAPGWNILIRSNILFFFLIKCSFKIANAMRVALFHRDAEDMPKGSIGLALVTHIVISDRTDAAAYNWNPAAWTYSFVYFQIVVLYDMLG